MTHIAFLWTVAAVSGIALAVAMATMVSGWKAVAASVAVPLAAAAYVAGQSAVRGTDGTTALQLFILVALDLALMRVVFAGWIRRQKERHRQGLPPQQTKAIHFFAFIPAFAGGIALIAFGLSQIEPFLV